MLVYGPAHTELPLYNQRGKPPVANGGIDIGTIETPSTAGDSSPDPRDIDGDGVLANW